MALPAHASLVSLFHHLSNLTQLHPFAVVVSSHLYLGLPSVFICVMSS
jgi:hypothetical protein